MVRKYQKPETACVFLGLGLFIEAMKMVVYAYEPGFSDPFTVYVGYGCLAIGTIMFGCWMSFE